MTGFIIIGKNEGTKLVRCIHSILKTIEEDNIGDYEIVYVDSNSSDGSVELVKDIKGNIKIYGITGKASPAIGRNIGAAESNADLFCFMDGDMELVGDFLPKVMDETGGMRYPFVSGQFENVYYDLNDQRTGSELYMKNVLSGDRVPTHDRWIVHHRKKPLGDSWWHGYQIYYGRGSGPGTKTGQKRSFTAQEKRTVRHPSYPALQVKIPDLEGSVCR